VRGNGVHAGPIAVVVVWLSLLAVTSSASAAFPGRNGLLAVTPVSGPGVALVNPQSGAATLVCTNTLLCGAPSHPQWSPNGRALIVVDTNTSRPEVLASDGTCLWCLLGRQLSNQPVNTPAFASNGSAITFGGGGSRSKAGLWELSLSGSRARRISPARVSDAVWSARGDVALVRGGYLETGRNPSGRLRKVARGTGPSWAPNGTRLAFVRGGWIWIVPMKGGAARRLAHGSSPAWSPDGRRLAYIGPGNAVEAIAASGGRPRPLAGATGLSVDWQPLPRSSGPGCTRPEGSSVMAQTPEALVTAQTTQEGAGQKVIGCLRALGKRQVLYSGMSSCYAGTSVTHAVLAGRYAALQLFSCDHYGACGNMASIVDLSRNASTELATQDCSASFLDAFDGLAADSSGFVTWLEVNGVTPYRQLAAISCPTASLCAAGDVDGDVVSTTTPTRTAPAWSVNNVYNQALSSMSCANASFCIAGGSAGVVLASNDPAAGSAGWSRYQVDPDGGTVQAISCLSTSFCAGGDGNGDVLVSANPLAGASTWDVTKVTPTAPFFPDGVAGIDCPSVSLCVAADAEGNILTSTNPTGGATSWQFTSLGANSAVPGSSSSGVACPSTQLCVVAEPAGILSSSNPTGGTSAWSLAKFGSSFTAVSCPQTTFCAAVDEGGNVWTTANPAGGATAWHSASLGPGLTGISCPSASLCVAVNQSGSVFSSTDPAANAASAWTSAAVDVLPCPSAMACSTAQLLAHDDSGTRVVDATTPEAGESITNIALAGDSLVLQWTDAAGAMQLGLR
jgi:hypothetical protein